MPPVIMTHRWGRRKVADSLGCSDPLSHTSDLSRSAPIETQRNSVVEPAVLRGGRVDFRSAAGEVEPMRREYEATIIVKAPLRRSARLTEIDVADAPNEIVGHTVLGAMR